jgi:hypothetical protein
LESYAEVSLVGIIVETGVEVKGRMAANTSLFVVVRFEGKNEGNPKILWVPFVR